MGRNPIRQRPTAPVRMLSLRWHYPNQVTRVEGGTLLSACHTSSPTIYLYTPILYTHCLTNTSLAGGNFGGRWPLLGPAQVSPCKVVSRPVPGGGSRLSLEKARTQRVAGGWPPAPPFFRARSFPLARFGVGCHIVPIDGLLRCPCTCPDLETFFRKMLFHHIFPEKCVPNRC